MADGVVIPLTGTGDATAKVAVDIVDGDKAAQLFKLAYAADGSALLVPADADGLVVQQKLEDPNSQLLQAAALAAGSGADVDAANLTSGKTGRLLGADIGASVPVRCDLQTVSGARTARAVIFADPGRTASWRAPAPRFIELLGTGTSKFGAHVVNLSPHAQADVWVTLYWDEVS